MAKQLTIQDLRNNISNSYKNKGSKCDFSKYYDNPQEIINYDPICFLNGLPDFMNAFKQFDYKNILQILYNVNKKIAKKKFEYDYGSLVDYSNPDNFIYYDKSNKVIIK